MIEVFYHHTPDIFNHMRQDIHRVRPKTAFYSIKRQRAENIFVFAVNRRGLFAKNIAALLLSMQEWGIIVRLKNILCKSPADFFVHIA